MNTFEDFKLPAQLQNAITDLGFDKPTPIQAQVFSIVLSGRDLVGIAQTGTGKTIAYLLPVLKDMKFSKQLNPRILILVPTRELVIQVADMASKLARYMNYRISGVYGGTNINTQKQALVNGTDILVATPGRLYDLVLSGSISLKGVNKLVIDEVDVMLDLGFRFQLMNIFEHIPKKRQNIMFSATMTKDVDALIDDVFVAPVKVSIALSGTPLENIEQQSYAVKNFFTKVNLLDHLLQDRKEFRKVLVFLSSKKYADKLYSTMEEKYGMEACVIHSNKTQNYRFKSIQKFDEGKNRILISTDVMARGLDLDKITHVINFDTPDYPENYMHRIGRTGRAKETGKSILFFTEKELPAKESIERLMDYKIPLLDFPEEVIVSGELLPEERVVISGRKNTQSVSTKEISGPSFHEKKEKNKKTPQGGSYRRELAKKYKKPLTRGDKNFNRRNKKK